MPVCIRNALRQSPAERIGATVDSYFSALDHLIKAVKIHPADTKTRKAIKARVQAIADSLVDENGEEDHQDVCEDLVPHVRCSCGRRFAVPRLSWRQPLPGKICYGRPLQVMLI